MRKPTYIPPKEDLWCTERILSQAKVCPTFTLFSILMFFRQLSIDLSRVGGLCLNHRIKDLWHSGDIPLDNHHRTPRKAKLSQQNLDTRHKHKLQNMFQIFRKCEQFERPSERCSHKSNVISMQYLSKIAFN